MVSVISTVSRLEHQLTLLQSGKFVGAIDNGTTSSRFLIFDSNGEPVAQHQIEFKQIYPHSG